jgi:hypothetical protein
MKVAYLNICSNFYFNEQELEVLKSLKLKYTLSGQPTADLTSSGPPNVTLIYIFVLHNKRPRSLFSAFKGQFEISERSNAPWWPKYQKNFSNKSCLS